MLERTVFSHKDKTLPLLKSGKPQTPSPGGRFSHGVRTKDRVKILSRINSLNSFRFAPVRHLSLTLTLEFTVMSLFIGKFLCENRKKYVQYTRLVRKGKRMMKKTPEEIKALIKAKEDKIRTWTEEKVVTSKEWIENEETQIKRNLIRGGVYMCALGENIGSEQGELRPVIVISNDLINTSSGNVYIVPLTKNLKKKIKKDSNRNVVRDGRGNLVFLDEPKLQSHYFLKKKKYNFLEHDSAAMAEVSRAVSKIRIKTHLGTLDTGDLKRISTRLEWVLGIKTSSRKR